MVQNSYEFIHAEGFVGQMADLQLANIFSRTVKASEIDFGLAVVRGTGDEECILATTTGGSFLGLTVRTVAGVAGLTGDRKYQINESANILDEGVIFAICEDAYVQGNPVSFRYAGTGTLGALRTAPVANETDVIPNAVWDSSGVAGSIGKVKFK